MLPDMRNAQGVEEALQGLLLAGFDLTEQIVCGLVRIAFQPEQIVPLQGIQIRNPADQAGVHELVGFPAGQAIDVHGLFRSVMHNALPDLGRTVHIRTPGQGVILADDHAFPAHRTVLRHVKHLFRAAAFLYKRLDHMGNDIPGPFHHHPVLDPDILVLDLIQVVQGSPLHFHPADVHRVQDRHRGEGPQTADLNVNAPDSARRPPGREFPGQGPSRIPLPHPEPLLTLQAIDLDHHPVDLIRKRVPFRGQMFITLENLPDPFTAPLLVGVDFQPPGPEMLQGLPVLLQIEARGFRDFIHKDVQRPFGGYLGIELADRAGCGVAGVGKQRLAGLLSLRVQGVEFIKAHEDFSAHHQPGGRVGLFRIQQGQGHLADGFDIGQDIFPCRPIASGGSGDQSGFLINQLHCQTVVFRFADIDQGVAAEFSPAGGIKIMHLLLVVHSLETEHRTGVPDQPQFFPGRASHLLGRRGRTDQFGKALFQPLKLLEQTVVFSVRNQGIVQDIVAVVVIPHCLAKRLERLFRFRFGGDALRIHFRDPPMLHIRHPAISLLSLPGTCSALF